ncbi:MAG: primosomal protein N' [Geminicoccaceae bacterium]|nr:primosomal protein N' [Geminicoccaceae bacterium]
MSAIVLPVLLPVPLDRPLDYRAETALEPGTLVRVALAAREVVGVVWDGPAEGGVRAERLKPILDRVAAPPLPAPLRRFLEATAAETLEPMGRLLRLVLSVPAALVRPPAALGYRRVPGGPQPRVAAERRVVEALQGEGVVPARALALAARVSGPQLARLAALGLIEAVELEGEENAVPDPERPGPALEPAQAEAAAALAARVAAGEGVVLLEGVPGSGKTEVYFEAIAAALRRGRRVLVLLPEIALTAQWLERFARRFGAPPQLWHSGLSAAQRRKGWRRIAEGRAPVVVGARSALFLPLTDLGLVVVDEEHDPSFKQDEGAHYHARDLAILRARLEGCPVVLASATPSLETAVAAGAVPGGPGARPGWSRFVLPARVAGASLPRVELVDLRRERPPRGAFLAPPVRAALAEAVGRGEQALLFLNRRGFAPLTLCRACGHRLRCPSCTAWLTAHRLKGRLLCHHCGWSMPSPEHCPACGAIDTLVVSGPGVERIAEEARALLPSARIRIVTSDTVATAAAAAELVRAVLAGEVDLLVGTQMIAKGHHFPALTLVVVVDADLGLTGGDPRAAERSFQLLYQVAGRAGRAALPGRVLVQTHDPEHPVMAALATGDRPGFLAAELEERRAGGLPPFGRLAALVVSGNDAATVQELARKLARAAPPLEGVRVLGPAPAPLALLRGRWRERILVQAGEGIDLPGYLRGWLAGRRLPPRAALEVDVDPVSFL